MHVPESIRPDNCLLGEAPDPLSHPYQLPASGVESELNIQFARLNLSFEGQLGTSGMLKKIKSKGKI